MDKELCTKTWLMKHPKKFLAEQIIKLHEEMASLTRRELNRIFDRISNPPVIYCTEYHEELAKEKAKYRKLFFNLYYKKDNG